MATSYKILIVIGLAAVVGIGIWVTSSARQARQGRDRIPFEVPKDARAAPGTGTPDQGGRQRSPAAPPVAQATPRPSADLRAAPARTPGSGAAPAGREAPRNEAGLPPLQAPPGGASTEALTTPTAGSPADDASRAPGRALEAPVRPMPGPSQAQTPGEVSAQEPATPARESVVTPGLGVSRDRASEGTEPGAAGVAQSPAGPEVSVPPRREPETRDARRPSGPQAPGAPAASPAPPRSAPAVGTTYIIQPDDTLSAIAREVYGDDRHWVAIAAANPAIDPDRLLVGQTITLPPRDEVLRGHGAPGAARPAGQKPQTDGSRPPTTAPARRGGRPTTYTVRAGDTLISIARSALNDAGRWREIYELNKDRLESPDVLLEGMELKLPPAAPQPEPSRGAGGRP